MILVILIISDLLTVSVSLPTGYLRVSFTCMLLICYTLFFRHKLAYRSLYQGCGSGSVGPECFWTSRIWTHYNLHVSGSFYTYSSKKVRKPLVSTVLWLFMTFYDFLSLKNAVLRIHDILGWIRIRGSMPLTNGSGFGSGSFYFRHWPSRCKQKTNFLTQYFLLMTFWTYIYIIFQR